MSTTATGVNCRRHVSRATIAVLTIRRDAATGPYHESAGSADNCHCQELSASAIARLPTTSQNSCQTRRNCSPTTTRAAGRTTTAAAPAPRGQTAPCPARPDSPGPADDKREKPEEPEDLFERGERRGRRRVEVDPACAGEIDEREESAGSSERSRSVFALAPEQWRSSALRRSGRFRGG